MKIVLITLIAIGVLALLLAVILYLVAQKFRVEEDPKIGDISAILPGANCGGCGYPGCGGFATACAKASSLEGIFCPVGGNDIMKKIAEIMGVTVAEQEPKIAVLCCNGTNNNRPKITKYDGVVSCAIAHATFGGETGCIYGCLGFGDCVTICQAEAATIDKDTGLPVFNDKCTSCGACVKVCPRGLLELRNKGKNNRRVYVACRNVDKGADARKSCAAACIGCGKCFRVCPFEAISLDNNLAYIDFMKCKLCRKCTSECPTGAIIEVNFPPKKTTEIN
jgi:RnfABCDGE-type electron transport complex B subunit